MTTIFSASELGLSAIGVISRVDRLIRCAVCHHGVAIGDYLLDVVLPVHFKKQKLIDVDGVSIDQWNAMDKIDFRNVAFWFKTQENTDRFVDLLQPSALSQGKPKIKNNTGLTLREYSQDFGSEEANYPFRVKQYYVMENDKHIFSVDLVVSDEFPDKFPECDYSMNLMSWDGKIVH